jgi:hypothetical protein
MSQVIIPKSDQINADSLLAGPLTVTIKDVKIMPGTEQPVSIVLAETDLVYRPCKSMSRCLVSAWGPDAKKYIGRSLTLYRDPTVKWGGMEVGGIRISHMTDIDGPMTMVLTATKGSRKPYKVAPLVAQPKQTRPTQPAEDPAEKWANGLITHLDTLITEQAIDELVTSRAVKLTELKEKRPELHTRVLGAIETRKAEIAPAEVAAGAE